jgi:nitroreductase
MFNLILIKIKQNIVFTMNISESLQWRYATKKFDIEKKLTDEQVIKLIEAANLAPSSYGLQPFRMVVVSNPDVKEKLKDAAYGQNQVTDASHLVIFSVRNNFSTIDVENYVQSMVDIRKITPESVEEYKESMMSSVRKKTPEDLFHWSARQAYISLGFLLVAAATGKIDACPMEGFDKTAFDRILGLSDMGLSSMVMAAVGYRANDDKYQKLAKVRKPLDEMVIRFS